MDLPTCCHQQMTNLTYVVLTLNDPMNHHSDVDTLGNHFHYTKLTIEIHVSFLIHFTLYTWLYLCAAAFTWEENDKTKITTKSNISHSIFKYLHKKHKSNEVDIQFSPKTISTKMWFIFQFQQNQYCIFIRYIWYNNVSHSILLCNLFNWHNSADKIF